MSTFNDINIDFIYEILCDVNKNMDDGLSEIEYTDQRKKHIAQQLWLDDYIATDESSDNKRVLSTKGMLFKFKLETLLACMTNHKDDGHTEKLIFKL
jgi:hypothetical protein